MLRISGWINEETTEYENIMNEMSFRIRCAIPCIVQSFDSTKGTVECQPAIRERMIMEDGTIRYISLPLLLNVPVVYPIASGFSMTFPLSQGDEVLVVFSDLSIDNFWQFGNLQNPVEARRHDLSDGIAIPCKLSLQNRQTVSVNSASIKFNNCSIELSDDVTITTPEGSITASQLHDLLTKHYHLDAEGRATGTPMGI